MKRNIAAVLLASTLLLAPAAQAQETEIEALRAHVAALENQISVLTSRIDDMAAYQASAAAAAPAAASPALAPTATATAAPPADDSPQISFGAAPKITAPGGWSFQPFGRIQADAGVVSVPSSVPVSDGFGSELRRARLGMKGTIPGGFGYKFEVDFAGNSAELTDVFLTYEDEGLTITAGQHNNFQSLEELTSSRFSSFIERAAFTDAFGFERRLGLSAQYETGDVLVQAGLFTDNIDDLPGKAWSVDGRAVYAPQTGDTQLHLGASVHLAELETADTVRYRQRPLVHFTSFRPVNTGNIGAKSEFGAGLEAAVVSGPFHAAGEAYWQNVNRSDLMPDPTFFGGYAEVGYFFTAGDSRKYKDFKFDRTRPQTPVGEGGIGAIQLNLRYDYLDLVDAGVIGGMQNGYYASLVWVPTDYTRMTFNYGRLEYDLADVTQIGGGTSYHADVFGMRAQIDF